APDCGNTVQEALATRAGKSVLDPAIIPYVLRSRQFRTENQSQQRSRLNDRLASRPFLLSSTRNCMRHRLLLAAAFVYLTATNLVWIARDTRPPFWDMAAHQSSALRIHDAFKTEGASGLWELRTATLPYPPLYHGVVAVFYALFGRTVDAAQYANIPA